MSFVKQFTPEIMAYSLDMLEKLSVIDEQMHLDQMVETKLNETVNELVSRFIQKWARNQEKSEQIEYSHLRSLMTNLRTTSDQGLTT
jgi:hypothetical protein